MSFARRIREAWRAGRERESRDRILQWQMRLRLAKHFHQGVSEEPPPAENFKSQISDSKRGPQ